MSIGSILTNNSIKFLSGLSKNDSSLVPMVVKDWIADGTTVYTYSKYATRDDAIEKAIDEFGTGAIWLFAIPVIKKLFDSSIYKIFKLKNPDFDIRLLKNENQLEFSKNLLKNSNDINLKEQKEFFDSLYQNNSVLKNIKNKDLYKALHGVKFLSSTLIAAMLLAKIIKFKQNLTKKRINNDIQKEKNNHKNSYSKNQISFSQFMSKTKKQNDLSFCGAKDFLADFMFNPVKNTSILDGVIALTRLKEARNGEKKEILFKEICQILFVYGLNVPIQRFFEFVAKKINCPIELDPNVIFSKNLKEKITSQNDTINSLLKSKNLSNDILKLDAKSTIIELLEKNDAISTIKKQNQNVAINYLKMIDEQKVKQTLKSFLDISKNNVNLGASKAFKVFAVLANISLVSFMMGFVQPKLTILMRKKLNQGDNRNPAIVKQEELLRKKQN